MTSQLPQWLMMLCAWGLTALFIHAVLRAFTQGMAHLKRLHSVPCHRCTYCTGHTPLKCTVHPIEALTEAAIDCPDFEQAATPAKPQSSPHKSQEHVYADSTQTLQRHLPQAGSFRPTLL